VSEVAAYAVTIIIINKDTNNLYYLSQLFSDTLSDIKFRNISTQSTQEIEKIIHSPNTKMYLVITKYQQKY
jgi:hypothetical protein